MADSDSRRAALISVASIVLALVTLACNFGAPPPTPTPSATPTATATPLPRSAEVTELQERVESRIVAEAQWRAASIGEQVEVGGGVKTGEASRARVDITDGTILRLAANTEFKLTALSAQPADPVTRFTLAVGKVWVFVTQALGAGTFEIETPVGVATVRGSLMSVEYFPVDGHMIVSCLEGLCRLTGTGGQFTDLTTGEQAEIPGFDQDPTSSQPIDTEQLGDWEQEFPEAQGVVVTLTPGLPPTDTPTATPTLTSTPTITPTPTAPPIAVVGRWAGRTDTGWNVTFDVTAEGQVSTLRIQMPSPIPCGQGGFLGAFTFQFEAPIVNDQFTLVSQVNASNTATGQFTSATTATGTFNFSATLSNGCTVARSGTWEAQVSGASPSAPVAPP